MTKEMTRYSKTPDKLNRKNTLVTIREDDVVYFGIARCNKKAGDKFTKRQGQVIAKARAIRAKIEKVGGAPLTGLVLHESNLRGSVPADGIPGLLKYFNTIDEVLKTVG